MNKQSRILVFGIALMFVGLSMWRTYEISLIDFDTSADAFGRLLFIVGLVMSATCAFDIQWSWLWKRVLMFWRSGQFTSASNEDSIVR